MRNEVVLSKAGLCCPTDVVSEAMECTIWKARKVMNPLGRIFQRKVQTRMTISADHENICQPVPGHPEVAANKLAQIWNILNLNSAKSLGSAVWCKMHDSSPVEVKTDRE